MSHALDTADAIKLRLETAPVSGEIATATDITAVDVIVDRQKQLLAAVNAAIAKKTGTAITILWTGWSTIDKNASTPRLAHSYTITVWTRPVLQAGAYPADDVMESIINRMWQWVPGGGHAHGEAEARNGGLVPHKSYLIYDCEVLIPVSH